MRKAIAIIGEPCVGKSGIIRRFMVSNGWEFRHIKHTPYHFNSLYGNLAVLGRYDEGKHQFPGTDRLSMGVMPHAIDFIGKWGGNIMFEGDRLSNGKFIDALINYGYETTVICVNVSRDVLDRRRDEEREQSETFIGRQRTKVSNLCSRYEHILERVNNDTVDDREKIIWSLRGRLESAK